MDGLTALEQTTWDTIKLLVDVVWSLGWPGLLLVLVLFSVAWSEATHR